MARGKTAAETPNKRESILTAARVLFTEHNYEKVTIADIARQAGVAVGTVYLYFRNKHEVYTAVALDLDARLAQFFEDPRLLELPLAQALAEMIDAIFQFGHTHLQLMSMLQVDFHSLEDLEQHQQTHNRIVAALVHIFDQAITRGELAPFDTRAYAEMLNVLGNSLMHQCFGVEQGQRTDYFRAALTDLIQRLFFGPALNTPEKI